MTHIEQLKQFHRGKVMLPYPIKYQHYVLHGVKLVDSRPKGIFSMTTEYVHKNNHGQLFSAFIKESQLSEAMTQVSALPKGERFNVINDCADLSKKQAREMFDTIPAGYILINITDVHDKKYWVVDNLVDIERCSNLKLINKKSKWLK